MLSQLSSELPRPLLCSHDLPLDNHTLLCLNRYMVKRLIATLASTATLSIAVAPAFAAGTALGLCAGGETGDANFSALCYLDFSNFPGMIISVVFVLAIIAALAYLIWGGVKWIISGGDKTKVDDARKAIVAAIVGLVLVFLSYFIISIVVPIFVPGFNLTNLQLPSVG